MKKINLIEKIKICFGMGRKDRGKKEKMLENIVGKKEKVLVTTMFSTHPKTNFTFSITFFFVFSPSPTKVFKRLLSQGRSKS